MNTKKLIYVVTVMSTLLMGCADAKLLFESDIPKNVNDSSEVVDLSIAIENPPIYIEDACEKVCIVPLETNEQSVLSNIKKVIATNEYIYVLDNYTGGRVSIFTIDGKFVKSLPQGQGHEEYLVAHAIHWSNYDKKLYVLDEKLQKILIYTPDGIYKDSYVLKEWYTDAVITQFGILTYQASRTNSKGEIVISLLENDSRNKQHWNLGRSTVKNAETQSDFLYYDGGYIVNKNYDNCIYYYKNNQLYRRYILSTPNYRDIGEFNTFSEFGQTITEKDCFFLGQNFETKDYLLISYIQKTGGGVFVYNKQNDIAYRLSAKEKNIFFSWIHPRNVQSTSDNTFVGIVDNMSNIKNPKSIGNMGGLISDSDMAKIHAMKPDDNPIIVLFKLKNNI